MDHERPAVVSDYLKLVCFSFVHASPLMSQVRCPNGRLGFEEVEATVAYFRADMHFHTALWTFLLRRLSGHGLLQLLFTRCVGLLHGALRMDTTRGVRPLSTNRTDLPVVFTKDWSGLLRVFSRHVPNCKAVGRGREPENTVCCRPETGTQPGLRPASCWRIRPYKRTEGLAAPDGFDSIRTLPPIRCR